VPHRTVPSFTVEIKRARKPALHALTRKVVAPNWDIHHRPKPFLFDDLFADTQPSSRLSPGSEAMQEGSQARVGRVLPSLASMASLQARERQETKEKPERRGMARKTRGRVQTSDALDLATASGEGLASSANTAELVTPTPAVQEAHVMASSTVMPSGHVKRRRNRKGKDYGAAYRKAVRRGLALPPLRAGERWKRRLPPMCR